MKEEKTTRNPIKNIKAKRAAEQEKEKNTIISKVKEHFFDIPNEAQSYAMTRSFLAVIAIVVFIILAITARNPKILLGILAALVVWAYVMYQKVLPFFTDNAVFFDAVIIEQITKQIGIPIGGKLAKQAMNGAACYLTVQHDNDVYKITIPHLREEYCNGKNVRVYFRKGERYEQSANFFTILDPMYIVTK